MAIVNGIEWGERTNAAWNAMPYELDQFYVLRIEGGETIAGRVIDAAWTRATAELVVQHDAGVTTIVNRRHIMMGQKVERKG